MLGKISEKIHVLTFQTFSREKNLLLEEILPKKNSCMMKNLNKKGLCSLTYSLHPPPHNVSNGRSQIGCLCHSHVNYVHFDGFFLAIPVLLAKCLEYTSYVFYLNEVLIDFLTSKFVTDRIN